MNRGDIKLVIDQLDQMDFGSIEDKHIKNNAVTMLETLGNKVAEQAAVIERLRDALLYSYENQSPLDECNRLIYIERALSLPTNSKQILKDWMREQLGEPRSYLYKHHYHDGSFVWSHKDTLNGTNAIEAEPLFKLPECLK